MEKKYINLIIESWASNAQMIDNIFYREFKAADKADIPPNELRIYLLRAVEYLEQKRSAPYHRQLEMWNDLYCSKADKGIEFDMPMPEDTYTLPTSHLTDLRICLQLSKQNILYIKESIESAFNRYEKGKDSFTIDFKNTYEKEVTKERKEEIIRKLSEIDSVEERIAFLENEKIAYLQNIDAATLDASGVTMLRFGAVGSLFFDRWIELEIKKQKLNAVPHQQKQTPVFTNNFDMVTPIEVYNHFKGALVDKGYLSELDLNKYLKAAFELRSIPKTRFKLKHTPTKQKIYTVFYIYYKDISGKRHEKQKEYAALLGDYFEGYKTEIIQTNWAKGYNTKR